MFSKFNFISNIVILKYMSKNDVPKPLLSTGCLSRVLLG